MKDKNFIANKEKELMKLNMASNKALDVVTTTIDLLAKTNENIDKNISEITEAKARLQATEDGLNKTKDHNVRIIERFRALIND